MTSNGTATTYSLNMEAATIRQGRRSMAVHAYAVSGEDRYPLGFFCNERLAQQAFTRWVRRNG